MVTNRLLLWELKRTFTLYAYFLTYAIRAHRLITEIDAWIVGCDDIFAFEAIAEKGHKRDPATATPPLVHFLGGSSFGAFQDLEEMRIWIQGFVRGLALQTAIVALHLGMNGRCDFHVLTLNARTDGRALYSEHLREEARALARKLTAELNERRLRLGLLPIGNLTPDGQVFFLDPRLELVAPPPIGQADRVTEGSRVALEAPPVPTVTPSLAADVKKERDPDPVDLTPVVAVTPAGASAPLNPRVDTAPPARTIHLPLTADMDPALAAAAPPPPTKVTAPATIPVLERVRTREIDIAELAAMEARARDEAKKKYEREQAESVARERARALEYDHFRKQLRLLLEKASEAESQTKEIHLFWNDEPGAGADDPELTSLWEASRRFLTDARTRALVDTTITVRAGDRPELRTLKQQCQNAHDQVRMACSELAETVAAITAMREHAGLEVDKDRRGPERA